MNNDLPARQPAVSLPVQAGLGLRAPHLQQVRQEIPAIAWFEVHSENYFLAGGPALAVLEEIRGNYPLSLHGVGMSLGGADDLDRDHLRQLKALAERIQPAAVSEHLCWSSIGGRWLNDLLPLPYTRQALARVCAHVEQVQEALGRSILVENVSSYLRFLPEDMPDWAFVAEVAKRTGCGVLLDVNYIHVSACNHGFAAADFLAGIAVGSVGEIHLAGYEEVGGLLMFSTLGPDTLKELRTAFADGYAHTQRFADMHDLGDMLVHAGFADPVMDQETLTLSWDSPQALLSELHGLGTNASPDRFAGLRTPRWHERLLAGLRDMAAPDGRISLQFEVAYGHAFKAAPRAPLSAETTVSLDDMRAMVRTKSPRT